MFYKIGPLLVIWFTCQQNKYHYEYHANYTTFWNGNLVFEQFESYKSRKNNISANCY